MLLSHLLFIGTPELVVVMLGVLLLFGSKNLPSFARGLGRGIRQFREATQEIQRDITSSVTEIEKESDITKNLDDKK